jgi:N6-adenosine-specific RNA methylase IME4
VSVYTDFSAIPRASFGCVMADPPWSFKSWSDKGKNRAPDALVRQKGLAERHYKTMPMHEIRALPVAEVCAKDAALFLWAVDCMLPEAIEVGTAWGFKFKTVAFTWTKATQSAPNLAHDDDRAWHKSLGYWTRGNPEMCLLFTKGSPRRLSAAVRQLIVAPRREHSRKPEDARERIETLLPGPYLEMFCRQPRPGWAAFGNQIGDPLPQRPVISPARGNFVSSRETAPMEPK